MQDSPRTGSLLVIFLTVFIDLLGFGMVIPLLPLYADQFTVDEGGWQLGLLMASYSAMQFVFAPFWGRLSDRVGRRPVLMVGLGGSVIFYALFGIATVLQSFALLFVARLGAGVAGATISTAQAYIADCTTVETRPKGMALIGMAFGLGFTFGPLLGFLAVPNRDAIPGPGPGYFAAGLSLFALVLAIRWLPESKHASSEKAHGTMFDFGAFRTALAVPSIGLVLLAIFVCLFSFANFETTLSLLIKASDETAPFTFSWGQVCLTYAFIGFHARHCSRRHCPAVGRTRFRGSARLHGRAPRGRGIWARGRGHSKSFRADVDDGVSDRRHRVLIHAAEPQFAVVSSHESGTPRDDDGGWPECEFDGPNRRRGARDPVAAH